MIILDKEAADTMKIFIDQTNLRDRKHAEITRQQFDQIWTRHGGEPYPHC